MLNRQIFFSRRSWRRQFFKFVAFFWFAISWGEKHLLLTKYHMVGRDRIWGSMNPLAKFGLHLKLNHKVEKILEDCMTSIPSPSTSVKNWKSKLLAGKFTWGNKVKHCRLMLTNFFFKSLLTMSSNVLPLNLKQTFPPIIWIFTEGEGDEIKSSLPFKIFSTLKEGEKLLWLSLDTHLMKTLHID